MSKEKQALAKAGRILEYAIRPELLSHDFVKLEERTIGIESKIDHVSKQIGPMGPSGRSIIGPQGPRGEKGDRGDDGIGKDGKDADEKLIEERVLKRIRQPKDGKDADEGRIVQVVLENIRLPEQKENILDGPDEIRNKLELLDGDERLHFSHIGGLDEWEEVHRKKDVTFINGKGPLWGLEDVNVVGITIGQSIQWNGIQWVPFTPGSGSFFGSTEQSTTTPDNSQQTFAFAHAPTMIFWNGSFQFPSVDYTVSGNNITFSGTNTPQTGDTIANVYA